MEPVKIVDGLAVPLDRANVDTDAIIPKQFLKSIKRSGFGPNLFDEWRYLDQGEPGQDCSARPVNPDFVLNAPRYKGARILLTRDNFGCGSSREHAPQAIRKAGFRAVVAEGYAEIFFGNATNIGLPCVSAARADLQRVGQAVAADPALSVTVDLAAMQLRFGGNAVPLTMRDSARDALVNGRWDAIGELLEGLPQVAAVAGRLPYVSAPA